MLNFYFIIFYLIGQSLSYRQVICMGLHTVNFPKCRCTRVDSASIHLQQTKLLRGSAETAEKSRG